MTHCVPSTTLLMAPRSPSPLPNTSTMELTSEQLARYQHRRLCPVDAVYLQMDARQILAFTLSDTNAHPSLLSSDHVHDDLAPSITSLPRHVLVDICVLRHHRLLLQELCHYWTYLTWVQHIGYDNAQFWDAVALVETYSTTTQEKPRQLDRTRVRTGVHVVSCLLGDIDTFRALLRCSNLPVRSLQEIPRQHIHIEQLQRLVAVACARRDSSKMIHTVEMKRLMGWTIVTKCKASLHSRRSKCPRGAQQLHDKQESLAKRRKKTPQEKPSNAATALLPTEEGLQLDKPAGSAERTGMAEGEEQTAPATTTTREMDVQCSEQQACTNAAIHLERQTHNHAAPEDTADDDCNAAGSLPAKDSESEIQAVSIDGLTQQQLVDVRSIMCPNVTSTTDLATLVMAVHTPLLSTSTKVTADQLSMLLLRLQSMVDRLGTSYVAAVTSDEVKGVARAMSGHVHHAELYHVFLIHIHTLLAVASLAKNAAVPVWVTAAWPPSLLSSLLDKYADNHDIVLYSLSVTQRTRMFAHPHEAVLKRLWKLHCNDVAIITLLTAIIQPLARAMDKHNDHSVHS